MYRMYPNDDEIFFRSIAAPREDGEEETAMKNV